MLAVGEPQKPQTSSNQYALDQHATTRYENTTTQHHKNSISPRHRSLNLLARGFVLILMTKAPKNHNLISIL